MNNIEIELFDLIARAVNAEYPSCKMMNMYVRTAPSWPCVMFYEADNFSGGMDGHLRLARAASTWASHQ